MGNFMEEEFQEFLRGNLFSNVTQNRDKSYDLQCTAGLLLPVWTPATNISMLERVGRSFVYFFMLLYLFIGIAMTCDRLLTAIEVITSYKRVIVIKKRGIKKVLNVRVWNKTVATLTLLAFGPSSPEIIMATLEIFQKNFHAGDLAPGVIIGSAAFNCFFVIAFCMFIVPRNETRRVTNLRILYLSAIWALFGYIWLYIIVAIISPHVIELWEALLTLFFFPMYILWAYIADRHLLCYKFFDPLHKSGDYNLEIGSNLGRRFTRDEAFENQLQEIQDFEETRREYVAAVRELRKKKPDEDLMTIEAEAIGLLVNKGKKSRAFYRLLANRALTGDNVMRSLEKSAHADVEEATRKSKSLRIELTDQEDIVTRLHFEKPHYTVMESTGVFDVNVMRSGDLTYITTVEYETQNGTAEANTDYVPKSGTLKFMPGMEKHRIEMEVIDDDIFEQDKVYYLRLKNPSMQAVLEEPFIVSIVILDDDHAGIFSFADPTYETTEGVKTFAVKVIRYSGARGKVVVPYSTEDGTAKADQEYTATSGELIYENEDTDNYISIPISHEASYEKEATFYINLGNPYLHPDNPLAFEVEEILRKPEYQLTQDEKILILGRPKLGENKRAEVKIRESVAFRTVVDTLASKNVVKLAVFTRWKEALFDAYAPTPLGDEFEQANLEVYKRGKITWYATLVHFLTLLWTIVLIIVPPAGIWYGLPSFLVAMLLLVIETALVVDAAMHFSCTSGLNEGVTAIAFVAIGLSLPELYADRFATLNDDTADIPISSVYASNAIQLYLGLGVSYTIAAIYHTTKGTSYEISSTSIAGNSLYFCAGSITSYIILLVRRYKKNINAELGGPMKWKLIYCGILLLIWIMYLLLSILELYDVLTVF